ncbi:MAG: hypothetical protein IKA75_07475 [Bacteroidaceae bacterium]|nr:hypothetical protein [Bacteroidaceae bacterium]
MTNSERHKSQLLTYAINSEGKIVHINEVPNGKKCECFCPSCKEKLIAKNQGKTDRKYHFAHQSGTECDYAVESMLHLLAKEKIRTAFLERKEFWIEFEYKSYCSNLDNCDYICYSECCKKEIKRFDLKKFYDSCEQERPYENINRRSDLKLFSSANPNRSPIYLEFCVTHASDEAKLHSDNKIIEIVIESEKDVYNIIEHGLIERSKISFYGFKKSDNNNSKISSDIEFVRYVLYQSGKSRCFQDGCNCKQLRKSNNSLFEMCFHTFVNLDIYEYAKYIGYKKYEIKNCFVCKNYVNNYSGDGYICRLYKYLGISRYEPFDTSRAKTCHRFDLNKEEMEEELRKGCRFKCSILK